MSKQIRVGVIYGGKSGEHEVSLQTALAVINAMDHSKYEIIPVYITKNGEWRIGKQLAGQVKSKDELAFQGENRLTAHALGPIFNRDEPSVQISSAQSQGASPTAPVDVVFPLLHGTFGEDGTIQGLLEMADIPYVGAGVLASAVGMDKVMMKKIYAQEGLPQCLYRHFTRHQWEKDREFAITEIEVTLGYPCFVKPANLGSSVGITKAKKREELIEAVDLAFRFDRKVIVEEAIDAREIEVSVLGNEEPRASLPGEIVPSNEFYDYKAKYIDGKSSMIIPAELPPEQIEELRELAIRAFKAIDGSGLSRVDFFVGRNDGRIMINEINTMPGFTPYSMYPLLWKESGVSYGELLDELIRLAVQRHEEKRKIRYEFDSEQE
ncbi:D-alanine--D-alanine ligase [Ferviditalea candida]|uniref:D-alanine--D-alanine ligase n=1 Tax=Ferviditalea candida TaxID=3108399 RepID=A0ABU5ZID5_9BACL|nr:D-alanine--D-alanine ligase [Paenibacillaceae bacterium T2]